MVSKWKEEAKTKTENDEAEEDAAVIMRAGGGGEHVRRLGKHFREKYFLACRSSIDACDCGSCFGI